MATPSALAMLENHGVDPLSLLQRHVRVTGDLTAEGIARSLYGSPVDADSAAFVARLDADLLEYFEERAAIAEFDGGLSRSEAERQAYELPRDLLQRRHPRDDAVDPWA